LARLGIGYGYGYKWLKAIAAATLYPSSLTPILHNQHEKVQEASINFVGRKCLCFNYFGHRINNRSLLTANRGVEFVPAGEQMLICFKLLELL